MRFIVFDTESDGLAYEATKLHIFSYTLDGQEVNHTASYEEMRDLLEQEDTLWVGHNVVRHDMPLLNRILGFNLDYRKFIDTLAISYVLEPDRKSHGLGSFTEEAGVEKPKVDDWENVTWEQMKERCGSDCLINWWLWQKQKEKLEEIYEQNYYKTHDDRRYSDSSQYDEWGARK